MLLTLHRAVGVFVLPALALASLPAQATTSGPTMAEVVAYALRANPDLVVARLAIDSARAERRIAGAVPNPALAVVPGNPFQYTATEPLDIGPNRLYRTRAASQGATATGLDERNATRQTVFLVRQSFLDLLLADATRGVAFEQDTIVRHLLQSDSLRFREGDLAERDLTTTELLAAHADATLARADAAVRSARIALQLLMGVPHPDPSFHVAGTLEYHAVDLPLDSLRDMALAGRPDLAATRERITQSRSLESLANSLMIPVPGLAAVYQPQPFQNGSNVAVGLSFTVPVFYWFSGERRRAQAGVASAEVSERRATAAVEGDVVGAVDNLRASRALAERYANGLLEKARTGLEMQRFAYEHGSASLVDLLTAISAFGDTRTDYYTAVHDYRVAAYAIDRAVGRDLVP
jgi:cobalt-zinc-cadmium efflux system outer membrane protein